MPEPFRLFAPLPLKTEKVVLVQSSDLFLALPATIVREVVLVGEVNREYDSSVTLYQGVPVPVIRGQQRCPTGRTFPLVMLKTTLLKPGLLAIACSELPLLAAVTDQGWKTGRPLPRPWISDGRFFVQGYALYHHTIGIGLS